MTVQQLRRAILAATMSAIAIAVLLSIALTLLRALTDQPLFGILALPLLTVVKVTPAIFFGHKFQPAHPFIFGAACGFLAIALTNGRLNQPNLETYSMVGEALSTALICGISMFAGRQFKKPVSAT